METSRALTRSLMGPPVPRLPSDDFVQEGWIGVTQALDRFDASFRVPLSTFVFYRINSRMMDFAREQRHSWPGRHTFAKSEKLSNVFSTSCGRTFRSFPALDAALTLDCLFAAEPQRAREVIWEHFFEGEQQSVIARRHRLSPGRISQIISRSLSNARSTY